MNTPHKKAEVPHGSNSFSIGKNPFSWKKCKRFLSMTAVSGSMKDLTYIVSDSIIEKSQ